MLQFVNSKAFPEKQKLIKRSVDFFISLFYMLQLYITKFTNVLQKCYYPRYPQSYPRLMNKKMRGFVRIMRKKFPESGNVNKVINMGMGLHNTSKICKKTKIMRKSLIIMRKNVFYRSQLKCGG